MPAERDALASASLVDIAVALLWLRCVDGIALTRWDVPGAVLALGGMTVIALQPKS